jgi:glycosyltransferase involved in cell wall biosynthesis
MKIAVDARWIFPEISGIGNYTRQLLREFAQLDLPHTLTVLFNDQALLTRTLSDIGSAGARNIEAQCIPWGVFSPQSQLHLPGLLKRQGVDLFHSPNYMIPFMAFPRNRAGRIKCVTTIHDVIPLVFPDHAPKSKKSRLFPLFRALMTEVGRRSDAIITVSDASRRDILEQLHIPSEHAGRVHTVYNGVSERFTPPPPEAEPPPPENKKYTLLYVGRADPYKNVEALVKALHIIRSTTDLDVSLRLAGAPDLRYPQATDLAKSLNISDAVEWTGYLMDDALVETYRRADLLVHPSRYEGFGLQIIEAMACGTPVVCSNGGSLPEVAGDAAIQIDPNDTEGFAQAIIRVLTQPELAASMRTKGFEQSARFTWKTAARQTLDVYEAVAENVVSKGALA